ncbi:ornithine cyclodeaminase [Coxiella burnetii]|uniref:Ornithine cyclodeaminase n=2 Tax=Coxiella burnetii TaxID=777 RepID=Q83AZ8_COXBU|nr:ornithine cyclodeaminase [Coxiella burnetii]NP_820708.1 ornithine cyclodeaminase [Coxiella burnetii RSA 493]AAO91222.1 ornithine cyclodeaminase [Coxiella burnetii RSA 493]ABS78028.1 ornithine cyclodeaminase [Coxiella burnetii Dugway 5J108-111]ABX77448.1 ornithine cyclodeaminase [Coxiella burnetii RSA 331]AML48373.1 ornithine cyclodeaminase [Coxiella burnetii]AML54379.1 ornithine cyclodeaminase [Coxiella burnetii]
MIRVITVDDIKSLIRKVTLEKFFSLLIEKLETTFSGWNEFEKMTRLVSHVENGVIELMPFWGKDYYSVKYINGHSLNPLDNKLTIVGLGMLADIATGYPVLISEMTLLTALRTAATSALASKYLAKSDSKTFAIVGTGAQAEFQVIAHKTLFEIENIKYFDIDPKALDKFEKNLSAYPFHLERARNVETAIKNADIITTATAIQKKTQILKNDWIQPGMTINAIGGDRAGKTELDPKILERGKVVVEFLEQSKEEGEIQNYNHSHVYAELWELIQKKKSGRTSTDEIFIFDSVGFALEDHAILRLVYSLAEDFQVGHMLDMVPEISDPKDLFGLLF